MEQRHVLTEEEKVKALVELLIMFDALPSYAVKKWFKHIEQNTISDSFINMVAITGSIYYDKEEQDIFLFNGMRINAHKVAALYTIMELLDEGEKRIGSARYPFDYVIEHDYQIYQIINFDNEGMYKLNFRKELKENDAIPVVVFLNEDSTNIEKQSEILFPEGKYIIAHVEYKASATMGEQYKVRLSKIGLE